LDQWVKEQSPRFNASFENYYDRLSNLSPQELYLNRIFEVNPSELVLTNQQKQGMGISFFAGHGLRMQNHFYVGIEGRVAYKVIPIEESLSKMPLFNADNKQIVYSRSILSGQWLYSTQIKGAKKLELNISGKCGFFFIDRLVIYLKTGVSFNQYSQNLLEITLSEPMTIQRLDEIIYNTWSKKIFEIPKAQETQSGSTGQHFFGSLHFGAGMDYSFRSRWFFRIEYEYKVGFSTQLKLQTRESSQPDSYKFYQLRYQDKEHMISSGIGVKLGR
jgi:opacity protein-like surface antigen